MTMSELKNCPCCGHGSDCNNRGLVDHEGNALWWVECLGCGLSTHGHKTRERAIAAWNHRADEVEILILRSRIHEARKWVEQAIDCENEPDKVFIFHRHARKALAEPPKEEDDG